MFSIMAYIVFGMLAGWIVTAAQNRGQSKPKHAVDTAHHEPKGGKKHHTKR